MQRGTGCARTQVTWLRDRLLKLGVHVVGSARRIVLHLPRATPHLHAWRRIALALGACAGQRFVCRARTHWSASVWPDAPAPAGCLPKRSTMPLPEPTRGSAHVSVRGGTARNGRAVPQLGLRDRPAP